MYTHQLLITKITRVFVFPHHAYDRLHLYSHAKCLKGRHSRDSLWIQVLGALQFQKLQTITPLHRQLTSVQGAYASKRQEYLTKSTFYSNRKREAHIPNLRSTENAF